MYIYIYIYIYICIYVCRLYMYIYMYVYIYITYIHTYINKQGVRSNRFDSTKSITGHLGQHQSITVKLFKTLHSKKSRKA